MGKRSDFKRRKHDAYDTPASAVNPLLSHLPERFSFWEPCAGNGSLVSAIHNTGRVNGLWCGDIAPRAHHIKKEDALETRYEGFDYIITNPPWTRQILHPMIDHFSEMHPTWLLFDSDWMHTKQAIPYLKHCRKIVSVGRVSWMENGVSGKDNCAWYLFDQSTSGQTVFYGR